MRIRTPRLGLVLIATLSLVAAQRAIAADDERAFVSETWGFRIEKPDDGWAFLESGESAEASFTLRIYPKGGKGDVIASVKVKPVSDSDPNGALREAQKYIEGKPDYPDPKVVEDPIAGRPAPGIMLHYRAPIGEFVIRQHYVVEGGVRYVIEAIGPSDRFASLEEPFRRVRD